MAPTTRSAAVRGNSGVIEKQSTRIVKKKPQPRKTKGTERYGRKRSIY